MHSHCHHGHSPDASDYKFVPPTIGQIATADSPLTVNFSWTYPARALDRFELQYQNVTTGYGVWLPLPTELPTSTATAFAVPGAADDLIWVEIRARRGRFYSTWQRGATVLIP